MDTNLACLLAVLHVLVILTAWLSLPAWCRRFGRVTPQTERRVLRVTLVAAPLVGALAIASADAESGWWEWTPRAAGTEVAAIDSEAVVAPEGEAASNAGRASLGDGPASNDPRPLEPRPLASEAVTDADPLAELPFRESVALVEPNRPEVGADPIPEDGSIILVSPGSQRSVWIDRGLGLVVIVWALGLAHRVLQWLLAQRALGVWRTRWTRVDERLELIIGRHFPSRRPLAIYRATPLDGAFAFGFWRREIAVPGDWFDDRRFAELEPILLHELAHHRSFDPLWRSLTWVATALLWLHPLVHRWTRREAELCEQIADDHVLAAGLDRRRYARLLGSLALGTTDKKSPFAFAPGVLGLSGTRGSESSLERRLKMILAPRRALEPRRFLAASGLAVALIALSLVASQPLVSAAEDDSARYPVMIAVKKGWWVAEGRDPESNEMLWTVRLMRVKPDVEVDLTRSPDAATVTIGDRAWKLDAVTGQMRPVGKGRASAHGETARRAEVERRRQIEAELAARGLLEQRDRAELERRLVEERERAARAAAERAMDERRRAERAAREHDERAELERELDRLQADRSSVEVDAARLRARQAELEARLADVARHRNDQLDRRRETTDALRKLEERVAKGEAVEQELQEARERLDRLSTEVETLRAHQEHIQVDAKRLEAQLAERKALEAQLTQHRRELERHLVELAARGQRLHEHADRTLETTVAKVDRGGSRIALAAGAANGVRVGDVFTLYAADQFLGQAIVIEVSEDASQAVLDVLHGGPVTVGTHAKRSGHRDVDGGQGHGKHRHHPGDHSAREILEAVVVNVDNEGGNAVLNMGEDKGVAKGDEFVIYRGDHIVATAVVTNVSPSLSGVHMRARTQPVEVGMKALRNDAHGHEHHDDLLQEARHHDAHGLHLDELARALDQRRRVEAKSAIQQLHRRAVEARNAGRHDEAVEWLRKAEAAASELDESKHHDAGTRNGGALQEVKAQLEAAQQRAAELERRLIELEQQRKLEKEKAGRGSEARLRQ